MGGNAGPIKSKWHSDMAGAAMDIPTVTRAVQWNSAGGVTTQEQVVPPYAPGFPTPSVLDTPRTRLALAKEANRLKAEAHTAVAAIKATTDDDDLDEPEPDEEDDVEGGGGQLVQRRSQGPKVDENGMVLDLPGLRASAMYPWQIIRQPDPNWEPKYEGEPQRFLEYYYNVSQSLSNLVILLVQGPHVGAEKERCRGRGHKNAWSF